jgi:4-amino-4-deoxy-L-arabinose transferase-like glycosyltransferase
MKLAKKFNEYRWFIGISLLILIFAFFLRTFNLTNLPVFVDEAIYIRWSQIMANEPTLRFLPLSDGKQPLYMWVLMTVVDKFSDPLFAGRIVSALAGIGTLLGTGVLAYLFFKSKIVSLVAMLIWAISPFAVFFDRMALVDATLAFFAVWSVIFMIITAKTRRIDSAMVTGFLLGGALLTKSPAIFFIILMPLSFMFIDLTKRKERAKNLAIVSGLLLLAVIIGFAMYNVLRLGPNFHLIASRNLDYVFPISHVLESPFSPLKGYLERAFEWVWLMAPGSLLLLVAASIVINFKTNLKVVIFLLAWSLVPVVVNAEFAKVFTARYILYCIPFIVVLAAGAFVYIGKYKKLLYVFLGIFVIQALWFSYLLIVSPVKAYLPLNERTGYLEEWTAGDGIKEISQYLKTEAASLTGGKQVVVGTEGYFGTLPDGLQIYMQGVPNVIVKGVGVQLEKVPDDLVESKKAGNKTYLVINKSRLKVKPEEMNAKIIAQYPKTPRSQGTHDYVQFGPQEILYFFEVE